jgi:type I restriction enzyme R subunit
MSQRPTESDFEEATIERLERLGYAYLSGGDVDRADDREVVLRARLRANLATRYPDLPAAALDGAVGRIAAPDGVDTLRRNLDFHLRCVRGFEWKVEFPDGRSEVRHLYPIDWEKPEANDFLVVNQLPISGLTDRRPDILIYVNGLPLVLFELKNPSDPKATALKAFNQVQHYKHAVPRLFEFNALVVVSDGPDTLHGQWPAEWEWYAPWKSIDGRGVEPLTTASMDALVRGLFPKDRLLHYVRDFVVFEDAGERLTKKAAKYHQFFAVRLALQRAIEAHRAAEKRVGVVWHTTGSGKSLSMLFLVGLLRRCPELQNPTVVVQVDRADLDNQLHGQFVAGRSLVGEVRQAGSAEELRDLLRGHGGEVVFTTIEKFRVQKAAGEVAHPELSARSNLFVIADEAHRSQYGFADGFARHLADALPNARRIGFTGTPVTFAGSDTVDVFGEVIHTYDIAQSQADKATVPLYYSPRQVRLNLKRDDLDDALEELAEGHDASSVERRKGQWAALAAAAGASDRVAELAADLLRHFTDRTATLAGKGLVVCMTRRNCVALYDALRVLPGCPEVKVVMTGSLADDPPAWSEAGHLTTKPQREALKKRLADVNDPLALVIVCDMWLTGTDIPCLHTLYIDKPIRGHNLIQAISRVNRVFRDKPHGLLVDYIGIGDELREATARYTQGGGTGTPAPDLSETAAPEFRRRLDAVRAELPPDQPYANWRDLSKAGREDLFQLVYGHLAEDEEVHERFVTAERLLSLSFLLVKHLDDCRTHADEVIFYQSVRKQLAKGLPNAPSPRSLEAAVRDLVDGSIESDGVVDIFRAAGMDRADLSILDDDFLQEVRNKPQENLRLRLLENLMQDEVRTLSERSPTRAKSFQGRLAETLQKYHNRLLDAAAVIRELLLIRDELRSDATRAATLDLAPDELAFYDAVAANYSAIYEIDFLRNLVREVVQAMKRNLKSDWQSQHREQVRSQLRAVVKRVLTRQGVKASDLEPIAERIMEQAAATFASWPLLAV